MKNQNVGSADLTYDWFLGVVTLVKNAWKLTIPLFILSVGGAYISLLLLDKHLLKSHVPGWFAQVCGDELDEQKTTSAEPNSPEAAAEAREKYEEKLTKPREPGGANCDTVLASRWGTIPPRPNDDEELPTEPGAKKWRVSIPSAYLGFVYFITLAIWFLFVGRATPDCREWYRLPLAFNVAGVCSALFFTYIMFTQTEEWCPWCMVTHVINFVILIGHLMLRTKKPAPNSAVLEGAVEPVAVEGLAPEPVRSHPSYRLVGACVLLAATTGAWVWNFYAVLVEKDNKKLVQAELNRFTNDMIFLATIYRKSPKVKIPIRPDDPQISKKNDYLCPMVVFSDFQCPFCRTFANLLEKKIQPLFHNRLRVTWKHYPLSTACNKTIKHNVHPLACTPALAIEAVRIQGGSEAFWKAHDLIFAGNRKLATFDYKAMATELGLDVAKFEEDMNSEAVKARIAEDIKLAKSLGVNATPTIFLSNRRVESKLVRVMPFWQVVANEFNFLHDKKVHERKQKQRRAKKAKAAKKQATTPNTPGRSSAP